MTYPEWYEWKTGQKFEKPKPKKNRKTPLAKSGNGGSVKPTEPNAIEKIDDNDISGLTARLKNLDDQMENTMDFNEMIKIGEEQDKIRRRIAELERKRAEEAKAKTIQGFEDSIVSGGMFKHASLSGCDTDAARAIAEGAKKVKAKYPGVTFNSLSISKNTLGAENGGGVALGKTVTATSVRENARTIMSNVAFNGEYFRYASGLEKLLRTQYESDFSSHCSIEGVAIHEFGHAIHKQYGINVSDVWRMVAKENGMDLRKPYGGMSKDAYESIMHISRYGDTDIDEWFSECFADYFVNEKPKKISIQAVEAFDKLLRSKM